MVETMYSCLDYFSALICAILIFGTTVGMKGRDIRKSAFRGLIISDMVFGLVEGTLHFALPRNMVKLATVLLAFSVPVNFIILAFFMLYIYGVALKKDVKVGRSLQFIISYAFIAAFVSLMLQVGGDLFYVENGALQQGSSILLFYVMQVIAHVTLFGYLFINAKIIGWKDLILVFSYYFFPMVSAVIDAGTGCDFIVGAETLSILWAYVVYHSKIIDEEKLKEKELLLLSNTDALTRINNRKSYMDAISLMEEIGIPKNFCYFSFDLNGLKKANDNIGHHAGDELIVAMANLLSSVFCEFGNVYRLGGDEFAALVVADEERFYQLMYKLESSRKATKLDFSKELSYSYGVVKASECEGLKIAEMGQIADQRMYENKQAFYNGKQE